MVIRHIKARILSNNTPSLRLFTKFKFKLVKTLGEWVEVEGET